MQGWLWSNLGTILIGAAVLLVAVLIVRYLVKSKKQGKSSCGGNCAGCTMCGVCHPPRQKGK